MTIALLGTGLMGRPMAERILTSGRPLTVYNRTRAKAEPLAAHGATIVDRPLDAVSRADCIILMLADAAAIHDTILGDGTRSQCAGRTVIQMGTIAPHESVAAAEAVRQAGGTYFEAPVLGSTAEAAAGRLMVMVGAAPAQYHAWLELLRCFDPEPLLVGRVGQAAALKLALNQLIGSQIAALALGIGLARRVGVEPELLMQVLRRSSLFAPTFDRKFPRLRGRQYADPNFPTKHLLKDVSLAAEEARRCGLAAPALESVGALLRRAVAAGFADCDYSSVYEVIDPPGQDPDDGASNPST